MKNVKQKIYFYRVNLDTVTDVACFHRAATACKGEVYLVGENMKINAKSLLGAHMARVAWDELYVEADFDCYHAFEKFII
jgi:hypothetical protein